MQTYKGLTIGQEVITKIDYFDYKIKIPAGTKFTIKSFPPYPMIQGHFVYGICDLGAIRLKPNELKTA